MLKRIVTDCMHAREGEIYFFKEIRLIKCVRRDFFKAFGKCYFYHITAESECRGYEFYSLGKRKLDTLYSINLCAADVNRRTNYVCICGCGKRAAFILLGIICTLACVMDYTNIYYYPARVIPPASLGWGIGLLAFFVLMCLPIVCDIRGMRRWK